MKALRVLLVALAVLLVLSGVIASPMKAAQATATLAPPPATGVVTSANPNVIVTSPVLVSELHGAVKVTGTASLPNMRSYFLETRPLNADASLPPDDVSWVPATLPATAPVQNGDLATWDTTLVPDGLYELRLTVTTDNVPSVYFIVTPLRVNNAAFMAANPTETAGGSTGTGATAPDLTPRLTTRLTSNVRTGDSTLYPAVGILLRKTTVPVLGISSTGSGWFYIQIPNGPKGFISPFVVTTSGDFSGLPSITPPPPPPPPPTSMATATTVAVPATLQLNGIALNPGTPTCGQGFSVQVNVVNTGTVFSAGTTASAQDVNLRTGTVTATGTAGIPSLNPGANFVVTVPLSTTQYYNEIHQVQVNVNGTQITTIYTLAQGTCNVQPTAVPPTAGPTATPPSGSPLPPPPSSTPRPPTLAPASNTPMATTGGTARP